MAKAKVDEQISYSRLFFVLAAGFAAVTAWAIYDETVTRREYKAYQEAFFRIERDLLRDKVAALRADLSGNDGLKELVRRKEAIEAELKTSEVKEQIAAARSRLEALSIAASDATQRHTFARSEQEAANYRYTEAKHADPTRSTAAYREAKAKLDTLAAEVVDAVAVMASAEKEKQAAQEALDRLRRTQELAEIGDEMEPLRRPLEEAERSLARAEKRLAGLWGPTTEIVQQNLPEIDKVDRCESCHLGAARGGFETVAREEFRSHPLRRTLLGLHPPESFGCTTCHDGQGRATTKFFAHAPGAEQDPHAFHTHYWEYPLLGGPPCTASELERGECTQREYMQSKCLGCHANEWDLRANLACESDLECPPQSVDGRPMICDVPKPRGSEKAPYPSVEAAEAASATGTEPQVPSQKYCLALNTSDLEKMNKGKLDLARAEDRQKAAKKAEVQLIELAPALSAGLRIMEELGCYGCHPIGGFEHKPKPAPDLTRIGHKLSSSEWLISWIEDPKQFRPQTRMPRYWPELLEPNAYPYPIDVVALTRKRRDEATAMAAFLLSSKNSQKYPYALEPMPDGIVASAERGRELVAKVGCAGCHILPAGTGVKIEHKNRASQFDFGPDLTNVAAKSTKEWIYSWIRNPRRYAPATRMPSLRLTLQEGADIAEYLAGNTGEKPYAQGLDPALAAPELVAKGRELVAHYGCFGCHTIEGFEQAPGIGIDLSEFGLKTTDRLDFGDFIVDPKQQTWDAWVYAKLRQPRVYAYDRVSVLMPQFDLTPREVRQLMVVLKGMRGTDSKEVQVLGHRLGSMDDMREKGRETMRLYNCAGCHTVDGHTGDVASQLFVGDEAQSNGPPNLVGEGRKVQPDWLFRFLKSPTLIRPLVHQKGGIRMPAFGFDDREATALAAMFSALDGAEYPFDDAAVLTPTVAEEAVARVVYGQARCVQQCHMVEELKPDMVLVDRQGPNLLLTRKRLRADWVSDWMADPLRHLPYSAMPAIWAAGQNQLELGLQNPELASLASGLDPQELARFRGSSERQIRALRNFLWTLGEP